MFDEDSISSIAPRTFWSRADAIEASTTIFDTKFFRMRVSTLSGPGDISVHIAKRMKSPNWKLRSACSRRQRPRCIAQGVTLLNPEKC